MPTVMPPQTEMMDPEFSEIELKPKIQPQESLIENSGVPQSSIFARSHHRKLPQFVVVVTELSGNFNSLFVLFIATLMGFGIGLIFAFLFWHLQVKNYIF